MRPFDHLIRVRHATTCLFLRSIIRDVDERSSHLESGYLCRVKTSPLHTRYASTGLKCQVRHLDSSRSDILCWNGEMESNRNLCIQSDFLISCCTAVWETRSGNLFKSTTHQPSYPIVISDYCLRSSDVVFHLELLVPSLVLSRSVTTSNHYRPVPNGFNVPHLLWPSNNAQSIRPDIDDRSYPSS